MPDRSAEDLAEALAASEARVTSLEAEVRALSTMRTILEKSQSNLGLAVAASNMGLWSFVPDDQDLGETDARCQAILGIGPGTPASQSWLHVAEEDRDRVQRALAAAFEGDGNYGPLEFRIEHPDGAPRWCEVRGRVIRGVDGRSCIVGGLVDVTERKLFEQRTDQARKLESIGRLAGGIAHDFNNMLTAILSYAELVFLRLPAGDLRDAVAEITRAAERSADLTARLLAFARQQPTSPRVIDVDDVIRRVGALLSRLLGGEIELVLDLRSRGAVLIDASQLEQVIVNLATNARDAMRGAGRLTIESTSVPLSPRDTLASAANGVVRVRVMDEGEGIAPEHFEHLFEPFFTTKEVGRGTGLGLASAYGVVKQHGGDIEIESAQGRGTTVTVTLPAVDAPSIEKRTPERAAIVEGRGTPARGDKPLILVVDDEPQVRRMVARVLRSAGYDVLEAEDGEVALRLVTTGELPLALIVMDLVMPRMGGRAAAAAIRAERPELPVLFVSGYADEPLGIGEQTASSRFLSKPFLPAALLDDVRELIAASPPQVDATNHPGR